MAHMSRSSARPGRPRTGGKLALFEVLQAAQNEGADAEAVAPLVQPAAQASHAAPPAAAQGQVAPPTPRIAAPVASIEPPLRRREPAAGRSAGSGPWGFILGGASVVAALAIVLAVNRVSGEDPKEPLADAQPMPEVLDVGSPHRPLNTAQAATLASPRLPTNTTIAPATPQPLVVTDARRTSGLNYMIVQSYHKSEEDRAIATRDALLQNDVGATIETNIPGWPNRICVVGTVGFERIRNNPEYQAYRERLDQISEKYSSDRKIKKFDPQPFHWSRN